MSNYIISHSICMAVAWIFCVPIGILIAKFFKSSNNPIWLKSHIFFQLAAFSLTIAGFGLAIYYIKLDGSTHFAADYNHGKIGLFLTIGIFIQFLGGLLRPSNKTIQSNPPPNVPFDDLINTNPTVTITQPTQYITKYRKIFNILHKLLGISLLFIAYWNIYTGIDIASQDYLKNPELWKKLLISAVVIPTFFYVIVYDCFT